MRSEFDEYAASYDELLQRSVAFAGQSSDFYTQVKAEILLALLTARHGADLDAVDILDIGCGTGRTDVHLASGCGRLRGVDPSRESVAVARRSNPSVEYRVQDGDRLPYADGSFHEAFTINVMHHVPPERWTAFLREAHRVLRPGGRLLIFEHNPWNPLTRKAVRDCVFDADAVLLDPRRLVTLTSAAGFSPQRACFILFFPWRRRLFRRIERHLGWLPLGAQYIVAAHR
ncbi:MAG: class I SAM-dependent methyltransferase [Candidatus Krumholzibacteriia bacterium]